MYPLVRVLYVHAGRPEHVVSGARAHCGQGAVVASRDAEINKILYAAV